MDWLKILGIVEKGAIIAGAVATSFLAYYALRGEERRKRKKLPKLRVEVCEPSGHNTDVISEIQKPIRLQIVKKARYYSIRVWNSTKATEAKKVRVRVLHFYKECQSGFIKGTPPAPLSFKWAGTPENEQQHLVDIPTYDDFSIGYILKEEGLFKLNTDPTRNSFPAKVPDGDRAIIAIEVLAENAMEPVLGYLKIDWRELKDDDPWKSIAPFITEISEREFNQLIASQTTCAVK